MTNTQSTLGNDTGTDSFVALQADLADDAAEVILQGVILRVTAELPEDKQELFRALLESSNQDVENPERRDAIYAFLTEHAPQFETYVQEEIAALAHEQENVLGEIEKAANELDS